MCNVKTTKTYMHLFHNIPQFDPVDPLGDGLGDDIARERAEPEHIELTEYIDARELLHQWEQIHHDLIKDPLQLSED